MKMSLPVLMVRSLAVTAVAGAPAFAQSAGPASGPPPTQKKPVTDELHGVKVVDEYRWLEDWNDQGVKAWSDAQNVYARSVLDKLPGVKEIRERITELETGASVEYTNLVWRGGVLFALKHIPDKQQPILVVVKDAEDTSIERVIVDPNVIDPKGGTTIDWFVPSPHGWDTAVSLSEGGSESGTVHVYSTQTGEEAGDLIPRAHGGTAGGSLAWNAEETGFYYTRYPRGSERKPEDMDFYQQVYFHTLGKPTSEDTYAIGKDFPRIAEVQLQTSWDHTWLLASVANGDGGEFAHYLHSPEGVWTKVADFADKIVGASVGREGNLYLLSRDGAPRGKVLRTPLVKPDLKSAAAIVPESPDATIERIACTNTRLYILDQVGGPSQLRVFDTGGKALKPVDLPPISAVAELVPLDYDDVLFASESFVTPPAWYHCWATSNQVKRTSLFQTSPADFSDSEVVREFATSKDGTKIPVNIIRRKGAKLDGSNPTVVWGYGGYGVSQTPAFSPRRRLFVEQGGVFAVANIRGGGEFGEAWHSAGNLTNKQNVFDDFYAAARHMIDAKYTSKDKLAIMGGSNGGLLMGATFTQHPDLCKAVVSSVGIYDMLRVELSPNGAFNVTEFGTVKEPEHFKAMFAYSPYHRVRDAATYPAILFLTGANDPRVDPMQSRKMTARLQAASPKSLTLLRTSANAGHGIGSSLSERIEQSVDIYGFLFSRLGVEYKPVAKPPSGSDEPQKAGK